MLHKCKIYIWIEFIIRHIYLHYTIICYQIWRAWALHFLGNRSSFNQTIDDYNVL